MDADQHRFVFEDETYRIIGCAMEIFNNLCLSVFICGSNHRHEHTDVALGSRIRVRYLVSLANLAAASAFLPLE